MKPIDIVIETAFRHSRNELFKFISQNYGEDDPELTVDNLNKLFAETEIQITNDKFEESKGRGRPRKS